jgi:hypothetical protein
MSLRSMENLRPCLAWNSPLIPPQFCVAMEIGIQDVVSEGLVAGCRGEGRGGDWGGGGGHVEGVG